MRMRRGWLASITAMAVASVHALTPPSSSDGPVKLLACVVTPGGILEAVVDSQSDVRMACDIRCSYELGERMFTHTFTVTVPARYQGRVGEFDTSNARAGTYSGEIGGCEKVQH